MFSWPTAGLSVPRPDDIARVMDRNGILQAVSGFGRMRLIVLQDWKRLPGRFAAHLAGGLAARS
jgi:hypothetical protein